MVDVADLTTMKSSITAPKPAGCAAWRSPVVISPRHSLKRHVEGKGCAPSTGAGVKRILVLQSRVGLGSYQAEPDHSSEPAQQRCSGACKHPHSFEDRADRLSGA